MNKLAKELEKISALINSENMPAVTSRLLGKYIIMDIVPKASGGVNLLCWNINTRDIVILPPGRILSSEDEIYNSFKGFLRFLDSIRKPEASESCGEKKVEECVEDLNGSWRLRPQPSSIFYPDEIPPRGVRPEPDCLERTHLLTRPLGEALDAFCGPDRPSNYEVLDEAAWLEMLRNSNEVRCDEDC